MMPTAAQSLIPNPLAAQAPKLLGRLATFRDRVNDILLDQLAATTLRDPTFRAEQCPHPSEDIQATAQVLRVLTKASWDADDMRLLDACWRIATQSELFGAEFEAERHQIQGVVRAARADCGERPERTHLR
jgi:hypothetical protein